MDEVIIFKKTAFKHDITEVDIRSVLDNPVYEDLLEDFANKYLVLGHDANANLLEILYNRIDENTIRVFHAMPCRKAWYDLAYR
jgi:D-alanine-D-alanine ligase-like ATP-grasp enzyme